MSEVFYKIRSKTTGLFSTGGSDVGWNKVGKVWKRKGDLSSHFTGLTGIGRKQYRDNDAEVVEIMTVCLNPVPVEEYINAAAERTNLNQAKSREAAAKWQKERDLKELQRLQDLYGKKS